MKAATVSAALKRAYDGNPDADGMNILGSSSPKSVQFRNWDWCQHDNHRTSHKYLNLEEGCRSVVAITLLIFEQTGDDNFYALARDVYNYALDILPRQYGRDMVKYLDYALVP